MQTPSFALTITGYLALALHAAQLRRMDVIAPIKSMVYNITHEDLYRGGLRSARNSTRSLQQALPSLVPIRARKQKAVSGSKLRQIRAYPGMVWGTLFSMATKWRSKQDQIEAARTQDSLEQRICVHQNQRRNIQGRTSGCNGTDARQASSTLGNSASQKRRQSRQSSREPRVVGGAPSNWATCKRHCLPTLREGVFKWDVLAFFCLSLAGAGTVIALQGEVRDKQLEWGWMGIVKALRRPSKRFLISFSTHLPQLLTSAAIALSWRGYWKRTQKSTESE